VPPSSRAGEAPERHVLQRLAACDVPRPPEVLAAAKAQRWEPAEVLRSLLGEELAGRERSAL
jgi:hypothetical protein